MKKWTIGDRVKLGLAAVSGLVILLGLIGLWQIRHLQADSALITERNIPGIEAVARAANLATFNRLLIYKHISSSDAEDMRALEAQIAEQSKTVSELFDSLPSLMVSAESRQVFEEVKAIRHEYLAKAHELLEASRSGSANVQVYARARAELDPIARKYGETLDRLIAAQMSEVGAGANGIRRAVRAAQWGIAVGLGIAVVLSFLVGMGLVRSTTRLLRSVATAVSEAAAQVGAAATQVAGSSQTLAQGSSEQAASLEETSASLEEMSSMTKRNAESAVRAKDVSAKMRTSAEQGAQDVGEMNRAMGAIKESADEISKIVKTIDEIAFQTNILALNAAVEAARAGEAGMGFAVVADEVRSLAQRSAQSAKETAVKIEGSVARSQHGVEVSQKVSRSLREIVEHAREADSLVAEIAVASREQDQGITQLNAAMGQMDRVTQSNASTAEESASAAEELNAQAMAQEEAIRELLSLIDRDAHTAAVESRRNAETKVRSSKPARPGPMASKASRPSGMNGHSRIPSQTPSLNGGLETIVVPSERLAFRDQ